MSVARWAYIVGVLLCLVIFWMLANAIQRQADRVDETNDRADQMLDRLELLFERLERLDRADARLDQLLATAEAVLAQEPLTAPLAAGQHDPSPLREDTLEADAVIAYEWREFTAADGTVRHLRMRVDDGG